MIKNVIKLSQNNLFKLYYLQVINVNNYISKIILKRFVVILFKEFHLIYSRLCEILSSVFISSKLSYRSPNLCLKEKRIKL